jgi:hypothetical protein
MQTWRGCGPIIGYFTELQERDAMIETSEPTIENGHREGERTRWSGAGATNAERHVISGESKNSHVRSRRFANKFGL